MKKVLIKFYEWARYAEEDIIMAKLALEENGPPNQACFHAQQAVEKYLKEFVLKQMKVYSKK